MKEVLTGFLFLFHPIKTLLQWQQGVKGGPDNTGFYYNDRAFLYERGHKQYELTNHLGNVLATISDKKFGVSSGGSSLISYYEPDIVTAQDYYPFGMMSRVALPNSEVPYKFGFNGKMNDNEVKGGLGLQQDYGMRIYDNRVGRFLSVDPITRNYPMLTPYQFASNRPIDGVDLDGREYSAITNWLADKAKASGHPTLSTFVRGLGGLDVQAHGQQLANNVVKGNWHGVAKQLYSYSLKAQVDNLEETTKRAINDNDQEAYGELYSFVFLGALGDAVMGEPPTFKFSEHPVAKTNKLVIEAHGNFEAGEGNAANTTTNRVNTTSGSTGTTGSSSLNKPTFEPVTAPGGKYLNKAIKEVADGGGTPRYNELGQHTTYEGRTASNGKAWIGAFEYEVRVPNTDNYYRILKKQTGTDVNGNAIYKYGYSLDHYQSTIHEFKQVQTPPASTGTH